MSLLINAASRWIAEGPPRTWDSVHLAEPGVRGLFFESVPLRGRATRVFAWLGLPDGACASRPVPGLVLVHGGGGTAFARWVRWWNRRGFAAIAMDTCGAMPRPQTGILGSADWPRHSHAGPPGWGAFDQADRPPEDQWTFHACAAMVKAHSLLASLPEVDPARIGMTGISWGGYLACLGAGIDPRLSCTAPVYGCGYVSEQSTWTENGAFATMTASQRGFWREHWDPAAVLPRVACPTLWLTGTNDFAYWPPVWQRSAQSTAGVRQLCMKVRWPHGHIPEAEEARELEQFFRAELAGATPLPRVEPPSLERGRMSAAFGDARSPRDAGLVLTVDDGPWPRREWHGLPARIDPVARRVEADVPREATAAYLLLLSEDWLTTTSDICFPG